MKKLIVSVMLSLAVVCARANALDQIVPRPMSAELHKGSLRVSGIAVKCDPGFDPVALEAVERFAAQLSYAGGRSLQDLRKVNYIVLDSSETGVL